MLISGIRQIELNDWGEFGENVLVFLGSLTATPGLSALKLALLYPQWCERENSFEPFHVFGKVIIPNLYK